MNAPIPLPSEVQAKFREQHTDKLCRDVEKFARDRARALRATIGRTDRVYPRELVQDALGDTWAGIAAWDPARYSLRDHLCNLIFQRTWLEARHRSRCEHVGIGALDDDGAVVIRADVEAELAEAGDDALDPMVASGVIRTLVEEIRPQLDDDEDGRAVVDAWVDGFIERAEVRLRARLTEERFHAARKRLFALARQLPERLREQVIELLRDAA